MAGYGLRSAVEQSAQAGLVRWVAATRLSSVVGDQGLQKR